MEDARDHRDREVHRSEQSPEPDSMNWKGSSLEDDGQSEVHTAVDLSGLYELKEDVSEGTHTSLVGESGLWPELDGVESQPGGRLDAELDELHVRDSKVTVDSRGETRAALDDSAPHRSLDTNLWKLHDSLVYF